MEIAFEENVPDLSQTDLAFMCAALNKQMREHFAPRWMEEAWPVKAYKNFKGLPIGSFWPISIMPQIGLPGAAGYHTWEAGLAYGRVRWDGPSTTAVTASHETLELRIDPRCNRWVSIGNGRLVAMEVCDPCEADTYEIEVELFGEKRNMKVSDFVLPSYFVKGAPGPYTFLDTIDSTVHERGLSRNGGGYLIVREPDGSVIDYWGHRRFGMRRRPPAGWSKGEDDLSRIKKRHLGVVGEVVDVSAKLR